MCVETEKMHYSTPLTREDYVSLAFDAVQRVAHAIEEVPFEWTEYKTLALLAVRTDVLALQYVHADRPDYKEIALAAVELQPQLLSLDVLLKRANYGAIALEAVAKDAHALQFVPGDHSDYRAIALAAVAADASALAECVPTDHADYEAIARAVAAQAPQDRASYARRRFKPRFVPKRRSVVPA